MEKKQIIDIDYALNVPPNGFYWATQAVCCGGMMLAALLAIILFRQNLRSILASSTLSGAALFYAGTLLWRWMPYVVLATISRCTKKQRIITRVVFGVAVFTTVVWEAMLYYEILVHPDPQSALGIIFMPLLQMVCVILLSVTIGAIYLYRMARR